MVGMFTSSAVDCVSETRSDQIKDNKIGICCFSARHTILWSRANNGLARNHDMCPSRLTCRGGQFYWWRNPEDLVKTTHLSQVLGVR